jgi:hypothetical protein
MINKSTRSIVTTALRAAGVEPTQITAALATIDGQQPKAHQTPAVLLTQAQKARQMGVSRFTIRKLTQLGRLQPVEVLPGLLRYRADELVNNQ